MALSTSMTPAIGATVLHEKRSSTADRVAANNASTAIRVVSPHEYKEAALCLAEAFREDHVVRYAIDTPDQTHLSEDERFELHKRTIEFVTYAHCLKGLVLTIGENYDCVALWMPPGKNMDDWLTILRSGMWRLNYMLSKEGRARFFEEFLPLLGSTKLEVLGDRDNNSWYLNYLGTRASARGKGYARKLIEYVTKQADVEGKACYLESSHDVNLIIYGKLGFELRKKIYLTRDKEEIRLDIMVREPQAQQGEKQL